MKRISFFLALTLVILSFGLANADRGIHVIQYSGMWSDGSVNYINTGQTVAWNLRVVNDNGLNISDVGGFTYVIKSADAHWTDAVIDTLNMSSQTGGPSWGNLFSTDNMYWWSTDLFTVKPNGSGEDTVSYAPVSFGSGGIYDGLDAIGLRVTIGPVPEEDSNKVICLEQILGDCTTSGYEGTWIFLTGGPAGELDVVPGFWDDAGDSLATGAEICYTIKKQPDIPPSISGPWNLSGSHCALITADYKAIDPDGSDYPIAFTLSGAPAGATITSTSDSTAHFEWQPSLADVNTSISFNVVATESDGNASDSTVNVVVENDAPTFTNGCNKEYPVQVGVEFVAPFTATDNCPGDPKIFSIVDDGGVPNSLFEFQGNELHLLATDEGFYTVVVQVSDGVDATPCTITMKITQGAPFAFRIEKTENTPQGQFVGVNMFVDNNITDNFGGFKFVVAYDASALTFQGADVDNSLLYQQCGWEYFTYRFGPDGNCGSGCPSGILTVTGYAEANDGPHHPTCWSQPTDSPYILFTMNFLVSNDRTLECSYVPIRFFWFECGDNTVSNASGDRLFVSSRVMEYVFDPNTDYLQEIQDDQVGFPTYQGFQATCPSNPDPEKPAVLDQIDFINGGVDIICSKDVDDRGDINLDGLPYTIADAVMFTNYFIYGLGAFEYPLGSIAASDINADGMTLTVADLVYLIRVIVGDAQPYATGFLKPATVDAVYHINNGVVSVEEAMGAAVLHIAGDATPVLLADNMEMKYAYNAEKNITSAVVYSLKNNNFVGDFVDARGDVIDIEMATAKGNPVNGQELPSNFALFQNYPNPFNPATTISFALASSSDYHVEIYNLVGQLVKSYAGHSEAGTVTIEWDASNNASGVYFYKLTAGNFTATKKMVLLK